MLKVLSNKIRLEAFTATELDKILSGNKPCHFWTEDQSFGDPLRLHHQGNNVMVDRFFMFIYSLCLLPYDRWSMGNSGHHIINLMMEVERVSETLSFCLELTRLVAREDFSLSNSYLFKTM
jgi:hypothetical protein